MVSGVFRFCRKTRVFDDQFTVVNGGLSMGKEALATLEALPPGTPEPPEALSRIRNKGVVFRSAKKVLVCWGWQEWRVVRPALQKHIKAHGRRDLAAALMAAQKLLPLDMRRSDSSITTQCATSAKPDVLEIVAFLVEQRRTGGPNPQPLKLVPPPPKAKAAPPKPAQRAAAAPAPSIAPTPAPAPIAAAAAPYDPALAAFMATPIGALLPGLKTFMLQAVRDALAPHHAAIAEVVRTAVIEVIGGPAPEATTAPLPAPAPEVEAIPAPASKAAPEADVAPAVDVTPQLEQIAALMPPAPHDMESQLALAAKALGLPASKRESVVVVGLHPSVEQEVERFYGRAFRFIFKRPDAFNACGDLPASTDAILLCRKKYLPAELLSATRRYNIPTSHIQNNSGAVLGALREMFPESAGDMHIR